MTNPRLTRLSLIRDRALRHRERLSKVKGGKRRYSYWHRIAYRTYDKMHTLMLNGYTLMTTPSSNPTPSTVSSEDLAAAFSRAGDAAADAAISFDTFHAHLAKAQESTARGGAVIGNALRTIYERLARPEIRSELQATVQLSDTLSITELLGQLKTRWSDLTPIQRSQVAELLGGVYNCTVARAALS